MTDYEISLYHGTFAVKWLKQQPNLVYIRPSGDKILCTFNHTPEEEENFRQKVANELFTISTNTINEGLLEKITAIQTDLPIYSTELSVPKNNIGTSYTDLFTNYGGRSFFVDTTGFKKLMYQIYWDINGGIGEHSVRVIDHSDDTKVLLNVIVTNGQNQDTGIIIPEEFKNFRGRLRIQVKSTVGSDDPICDGIRLLLRR